MDYSKFLKDILKVSSSIEKDPTSGKKFQEMNEGLTNALIENLPEELRASARKFINEKTPQERIDYLMNIEGFDFPEFLEEHLSKVFRSSDPFNYKGIQINPKELKDIYEDSKAKFQKYEESEDINNF
jgi:hypothetical protein